MLALVDELKLSALPSTRCSIRSAPRATPPVAAKPAATRRAPSVIVIASRTFADSRAAVSFFAGRRVPQRATSTRRATSNWSRPNIQHFDQRGVLGPDRRRPSHDCSAT
jgi:hypothetical protein